MRGIKIKRVSINQKACCFYCTNNKSDLRLYHTLEETFLRRCILNEWIDLPTMEITVTDNGYNWLLAINNFMAYILKRRGFIFIKKWNHTVNTEKSRKTDYNVHECQFVDKNVLN